MAYKINDKRYDYDFFGYTARLDEVEHLALQTKIQQRYPFKRPTESNMIKEAMFTFFKVDASKLERPSKRKKAE